MGSSPKSWEEPHSAGHQARWGAGTGVWGLCSAVRLPCGLGAGLGATRIPLSHGVGTPTPPSLLSFLFQCVGCDKVQIVKLWTREFWKHLPASTGRDRLTPRCLLPCHRSVGWPRTRCILEAGQRAAEAAEAGPLGGQVPITSLSRLDFVFLWLPPGV